jgi:lysophospholipase L1-like esterase
MAAPNGFPVVPIGESASNVREMLLKAREYGTCVLLSPAPVRNDEHNQRLEALSTAYGSICSAIDVPFIDLFHPLMERGYVDELEDGVHPGPRGNTMIAELLCETLKAWFAEKNS